MRIGFERADFTSGALKEFLQGHLDELAPTAPAESRHALDLSGLQAPGVRLWVAHDAGSIVATGALTALDPGHEELKSMRTHPLLRGQGIGTLMLEFLLQDARQRGIERVSLETGSMPFFASALALYSRAGFTDCPPFGRYVDDPHSRFMTRVLQARGDPS